MRISAIKILPRLTQQTLVCHSYSCVLIIVSSTDICFIFLMLLLFSLHHLPVVYVWRSGEWTAWWAFGGRGCKISNPLEKWLVGDATLSCWKVIIHEENVKTKHFHDVIPYTLVHISTFIVLFFFCTRFVIDTHAHTQIPFVLNLEQDKNIYENSVLILLH